MCNSRQEGIGDIMFCSPPFPTPAPKVLAAIPKRNNQIKPAGFDLVLPRLMRSQPEKGFVKVNAAAAADFGMNLWKVYVINCGLW